MAKSILNTTLEFGVVSVPIAVMPVESKQDVTLDNASQDDNAMSQVYVDAVTGAQCPRETWKKGVFRSKPSTKDRSTWEDFAEIDKDALTAIEEAGKVETFEIEGFLPANEVPFERAKGCYYIAPQRGSNGAATKPLRLLYEALTATGKAGIVKISLKKKQYPAVVHARNGGIFLNTFAWAEDFAAAKEAEEVLASAEADPKMVAMAVTLIDNLTVDRTTLDSMSDDVRPERQRMLEEALAGKKIKAKAAPAKKESKTTDLEALLAASIKESGQQKKGRASVKREKIPA